MSSINDPIADLFTRIRNGLMAKLRFVDVPRSKMLKSIVELLVEQGYVEGFIEKDLNDHGRGLMRVFLRYGKGRIPAIQTIKRFSRPGCRQYRGSQEIPRIHGGFGTAIMSTSKGIMVGSKARKEGIGGELLGVVW